MAKNEITDGRQSAVFPAGQVESVEVEVEVAPKAAPKKKSTKPPTPPPPPQFV